MIAYQAKTMGHKVAFFWFIFFFDLIAITAVDLYEPIGLGNMKTLYRRGFESTRRPKL